MTENKRLSKYKDIGGISYEELYDLASNQRLKSTDEWKKVKQGLENE